MFPFLPAPGADDDGKCTVLLVTTILAGHYFASQWTVFLIHNDLPRVIVGSGTVTILEAYRALLAANYTPIHDVEFHWYSAVCSFVWLILRFTLFRGTPDMGNALYSDVFISYRRKAAS
jgi:hypothetical protein